MSHASGRGRHEPRPGRRRALWIVAAFLLVDAVVGLVAATVLPGLELWSRPAASPSASGVTDADADPMSSDSPALTGYPVLNGNQGYPISVGRPWGTRCAPLALVAAEGTNEGLRARLSEVIAEAAAGGVPVLDAAPTVGDRPVHTVQVANDATSTPLLADGRPQQVLWYLQTVLDPAGRTETIRTVSTAVFLQAARDDVAQRRALRTLLARSFGLAGSTSAGSGLTAELGSTLDGFSPADLTALRAMAGCD